LLAADVYGFVDAVLWMLGGPCQTAGLFVLQFDGSRHHRFFEGIVDESTATLVGSVIIGGGKMMTKFFGPLLSPMGHELGAELRDQFLRLRGRRAGIAMERAEAMLGAVGREAGPVDSKRLAAILDGASNEEDPDLSERWAALLANSVDDVDNTVVHPAFPRILNELTAFDARVLEAIARGTVPHGQQPRGTARERLALFVGEPDHHRVDIALDNLMRTGLIAAGRRAKWGGIPGVDGEEDMIVTNAFGDRFLMACQPPKAG
jgi:hypothetical protein